MKLTTEPTPMEGKHPAPSEESLASLHERIHRLLDVLLTDRDMAPPDAITLALEALEYVHCLKSNLDDLLEEYEEMCTKEAKAAESAEVPS